MNKFTIHAKVITALCIVIVFMACEEPKEYDLYISNRSSYDISNVSWKGNVLKNGYDNLTISSFSSYSSSSSYTGEAIVQSGSDYIYFTREGAVVMTLRTKEKITVDGERWSNTYFTLTNTSMVVDTTNESNIGSLSAIAPVVPVVPVVPEPKNDTALTIKNQSFSDLLHVEWLGVGFASNTVEDAIPIGNTVTKTVTPGSGYIYFKRKSNPAFARTRDVISITKDKTTEFVFTDTTLIVEANNPDNTGALKVMQATVVFFDDAEGEMQAYYEAASFVGYYATKSDLLAPDSSYNYYNPPKNGQKSIAVGGTNTAKLHLKITLSKAAKLSFWYANKDSTSSSGGTTFSINGTTQRTWTTDVNWSKIEYELGVGENDLVWEKTDGYSYSSGSYYYLTLDDILIYYTE
ncbi:MAG: hypothetical protein LBC51_00890 [Treponema sp.]|jgi:hypothetical protein|nr:hypothetical protein [Treponema sp.]